MNNPFIAKALIADDNVVGKIYGEEEFSPFFAFEIACICQAMIRKRSYFSFL